MQEKPPHDDENRRRFAALLAAKKQRQDQSAKGSAGRPSVGSGRPPAPKGDRTFRRRKV